MCAALSRGADQGERNLNSTELAHKIVDLMEEKQAVGIVLLDLRQATASVLADYFVICTSESNRQTEAILESIAMGLKQEGVIPLRGPEGNAQAGWTLLDYVDVVAHVFDAPTRNFYRLEELWKEAQIVLKMQ